LKVIGLTGGIGSGKSTVAQFFRELGATVIDADAITHQIFDLRPEVIPILLDKFGTEIIDPITGKIDRRRLGSLVFSNPSLRKELEALTHPLIREEINRRIGEARATNSALALIDAPLLVETNYYRAFEGLIVVKAEKEQQIQRILARDFLTHDEISDRLAAQLPLAEKIRVADWVIDNSSDLQATKKQVEELFNELVRP
jgi:dephospho-CoA kinase